MNANNKILYLRTDILNEPLIAGGSVTHTLGVIEGFLQEGVEVHCASSCMLEQLQELPLTSLTHLLLPGMVHHLRWRFSCLFSNVIFFMTILRSFKRKSFDYCYQRYGFLNFLGLLVRWWYGVPLILEYNGSEVWATSQWGPRKWLQLKWLSRMIEKMNLMYADYIVVVSDVLADDLAAQNISRAKILVNPNGVNPVHFENLTKDRAAIRKKLHSDQKVIFGFVGTFGPWHGIEFLEKLIITLDKKNKDIHWLLIGDGSLRKAMEESLKEKLVESYPVTFTGLLSPQMARTYLAACDVLLCPTQPNKDGSRFFGSPTKIFEYMCLKKPIIASNIEQLAQIISPARKGLNESFKGNEVGYLFSPENSEVCEELCLHVASQTNLSETIHMGNNAYARMLSNYTWQSHVQKIMKWVEEKEKQIDFTRSSC